MNKPVNSFCFGSMLMQKTPNTPKYKVLLHSQQSASAEKYLLVCTQRNLEVCVVAEFVCQVFQELNLKILQLLALVVARWGAMASLPVTEECGGAS